MIELKNQNNFLRVVTWNCTNGNFLEKLCKIANLTNGLKADVYIIQECPCPKTPDIIEKLKCFDLQCAGWNGSGNKKGVGIFVKKNLELEQGYLDKSQENAYEFCASCSISYMGQKLNILGIWAHSKSGDDYASKLFAYLTNNSYKLNSNCIIAGDFNIDLSVNSQTEMCLWSTHQIYRLLEEKELFSAYHEYFRERQGKEMRKTFRGRLGCYPSHIDYIFTEKTKIKKVELGDPEEWLHGFESNNKKGRSDHLPLIVDLIIE